MPKITFALWSLLTWYSLTFTAHVKKVNATLSDSHIILRFWIKNRIPDLWHKNCLCLDVSLCLGLFYGLRFWFNSLTPIATHNNPLVVGERDTNGSNTIYTL